jgi:uracil-DNA glycosylase family 4
MSERLPQALQEKISKRLRFYDDLGIDLFYRNRISPKAPYAVTENSASAKPAATHLASPATPRMPLPIRSAPPLAKPHAPKLNELPSVPEVSLFDAVNKIANDSLPKILADLGDCTRCKLHKGRTNLVFGVGNPKADLVFVGEGPGRDEDLEGLPFVGRAGKLLTQMIEAMGLQRNEVYICNVVKCRPPENRTPEKDEVSTCSPFLMRQIEAISPKVIVCLGSVAAQTLLQTNRGITHYRGEWLDFRGRKLLATYHPAYLLRNPSAKGQVWKDLKKVMAVLGLKGKKANSDASGSSS